MGENRWTTIVRNLVTLSLGLYMLTRPELLTVALVLTALPLLMHCLNLVLSDGDDGSTSR